WSVGLGTLGHPQRARLGEGDRAQGPSIERIRGHRRLGEERRAGEEHRAGEERHAGEERRQGAERNPAEDRGEACAGHTPPPTVQSERSPSTLAISVHEKATTLSSSWTAKKAPAGKPGIACWVSAIPSVFMTTS